MSTFKRGDVAVVTGLNGQTWRAIRTGDDKWSLDCDWASCLSDDLVTEVRPLVVIDPEDAEQVSHLCSLLGKHHGAHSAVDLDLDFMSSQAALREFADPKPRIEEPRGLGAVVEGDRADLYVRVKESKRPWLRVGTTNHVHWSEIAAADVLSEGVTS